MKQKKQPHRLPESCITENHASHETALLGTPGNPYWPASGQTCLRKHNIFFSLWHVRAASRGKKINKKKSEADDGVEAFSVQICCRFSVSICGKSLLPLSLHPPQHAQSNSQWIPTDWNAPSSDKEGQRKEASSANWSNGSTPQVAEYHIIQAPQPTASTWKEKKQKPPFVSQGFAGIKHSSPLWQTQTLSRNEGAASKLPRLSSGNGLF